MPECWKRIKEAERSNPIDYVLSQWQRNYLPSLGYLIYRWIIFLILTAVCVLSYLIFPRPVEFVVVVPLAFSLWGFALNVAQAFLGAMIVTEFYFKANGDESLEKIEPEKSHFWWKTFGMLNTVAIVISICTTAAYWVFLFDLKEGFPQTLELTCHGVSSFVMLVDLWTVKFPVKLIHFAGSYVFVAIYLVIVAPIFFLHPQGRESLTDDKPKDSAWSYRNRALLLLIGGLPSILAINIITWLLSTLRRTIYARYYQNT